MTECPTVQTHSPIGPSSYQRVSLCPGSMRLSQNVAETQSDDAKRGSRLHALAADWLEDGVDAILGADQEDIDAVAFYVNHCHALMKQSIGSWVEYPVNLDHPSGLLFGTLDFACVDMDRLVIVDYKSGRKKVNAVNNTQLLYYALMMLRNLNTADMSIETISLQIAQGGEIDTWDISVADLEVFADQLNATVEAALAEDAPLIPGSVQCNYCPAISICPAYKARLEEESGLTMENVDAMIPPKTPALIEQRYAYVAKWRKYLDEVEKQAMALAKKGHKFENFDAVDRVGNRSWIDEKFVTGILEQAGWDRDGFDRKLKSPTQILSALDKATKKMAEKATVSKPTLALLELRSELEAQIERKVIGTKLVRKGDSENVTESED